MGSGAKDGRSKSIVSSADSLGLKSSDPAKLTTLVAAGIKYRHVDHFRRVSGLSLEQINHATQIAPRTMTRRQELGKLDPLESDRVLRLSRLFDLAFEFFAGDADAARGWLESSQHGLGGARPLDYARSEVGAREVENLLRRLEHGVFS